ncbi:MAG: hypothetical protein NVSMB49_17940 [Ktedonobacteraceae bacterium]
MYTAINNVSTLLRVAAYRLGQVCQQLGFVAPLSREDQQEVQRWLPASALPLFSTMSNADQQHSLRVCRGLQAQGCVEHAMLAAALLHDVGKAQGRVPFWTRPVIVIGRLFAPRLLARLIVPFSQLGTDHAVKQKNQVRSSAGMLLPDWRRSLSYAWWHADVGANLASEVGLSDQTVLYIRTHHQPHGPAAALHRVDEVS